MRREDYKKNAHNWTATPSDYRLVFRPIGGVWREVSNNIACYANMVLADYLNEIGIVVDEHCTTFSAIYVDDDNMDVKIWYRAYSGSHIVIDYSRKKCDFKC